MLRRFLYLNTNAVDGYLAVVEGGLADTATSRRSNKGSKGGKLNAGTSALGVGGTLGGESSNEDERIVRETSEQRFDRLIRALEAAPEEFGYEDVLDLGDAFERSVVGSMVSVTCEIEIPTAVRLLAQPEQMGEMLGLMETMRPLAEMFGADMDGMPSQATTSAIRDVTSAFKSDLMFVGETDVGAPCVAGKLEKSHLIELPEGEAVVVGKVARRWKSGESHPLLALPGASILSRKQRRSSPISDDPDDENILHGPALTLDVLAIYR